MGKGGWLSAIYKSDHLMMQPSISCRSNNFFPCGVGLADPLSKDQDSSGKSLAVKLANQVQDTISWYYNKSNGKGMGEG